MKFSLTVSGGIYTLSMKRKRAGLSESGLDSLNRAILLSTINLLRTAVRRSRRKMRNLGKAKYKSILIVALTIFSLNATAVPTSAIDLGAKGKYIISVKPAARAAIEASVTKAGGKLTNKYSYVFDGYTVELPKLVASLLSRIPDVLTVEEDLPVSF